MFEKLVEFIKDMLGMNIKTKLPKRNEFVIQLKGSSIGKLSKDDLDDIGYFENYGTSGSALQGSTKLNRDELIEYLTSHFDLPREEINIILPRSFWSEPCKKPVIILQAFYIKCYCVHIHPTVNP